jgi:hypothetical protein
MCIGEISGCLRGSDFAWRTCHFDDERGDAGFVSGSENCARRCASEKSLVVSGARILRGARVIPTMNEATRDLYQDRKTALADVHRRNLWLSAGLEFCVSLVGCRCLANSDHVPCSKLRRSCTFVETATSRIPPRLRRSRTFVVTGNRHRFQMRCRADNSGDFIITSSGLHARRDALAAPGLKSAVIFYKG